MAKSRSDDRQMALPGTAPDIAGLLQKRASARLMASKEQLPCDIGLFSDDADQIDLVSWLTEQTEE